MTIVARLLNVARMMEKSPLAEGCRVFYRLAAMSTDYVDSELWYTISVYADRWARKAGDDWTVYMALIDLRDYADHSLCAS